MYGLLYLWLGVFLRLFRSRRSLLIENLALRQQLAVFKRKHSRPRLTAADKLFWVFPAPLLVFLEEGSDGCIARYGCALAPSWLSSLLAVRLSPAEAGGLNARNPPHSRTKSLHR